MPFERTFRDDISIVLAGEAGQGVQTIEQILTRLFKQAGLNVFGTKEYMSRVRGGTNSTEIRVASFPIAAFVNRVDIFVPLDAKAMDHLKPRLTDKTLIVGDQENLKTEKEILNAPFSKMAAGIGGELFSNMIAAGFLAGILHIELAIVYEVIQYFFGKKSADIIEKNCTAAKQGFEFGREACAKHRIHCELKRDPEVVRQIMISGHEAVALGAAAGGCNFIASYPMSPSTGVLTFLAQHGAELGILVEQAEDEIAAMNMGLGSWYAGGRAMVTTSGGGFALMGEGLSLAGAIESPMVIHLAQRPGPATGLPTRTEQGDLELALYAGHGEFPRVLLAPGTVQDAFLCASRAFYLADKYQIPVFILMDQYVLDSFYNAEEFPSVSGEITYCVVQTGSDYKRYRFTENGISPRGIPGFGEGIVCIDSDEHDEGGYITEDSDVRTAMVNKRLKKQNLLPEDAMAPEFFGKEGYKKLVLGWGSTFHAIREALRRKGEGDTAFLYFKQVYPLSGKVAEYMRQAKEVVCAENNATGQFAKLIRRETGLSVDRKVLKYDGLPFSVEDLVAKL